MLFICREGPRSEEWIQTLQQKSEEHGFTLKLESNDKNSAVFMNFELARPPPSGRRWVIKPHVKPTSMGVALSMRSAHPAQVLTGWQDMVVQRLSRRASFPRGPNTTHSYCSYSNACRQATEKLRRGPEPKRGRIGW